jgi:hypothetical protein
MKTILALFAPLQACAEKNNQKLANSASTNSTTVALSAEDAVLAHRFREIRGGALFVDATFETKGHVTLYRSSGFIFNGGFAQWSPQNNHLSSFFGDEKRGDRFSVPKTLRMVRYPPDAEYNKDWQDPDHVDTRRRFLGQPAVDTTVLVASRIPDEVPDRVRKYKGGLILKLRLTPETILVGWEVRDGKSYPYKYDKVGNAFIPEEDRAIGGDFCEAKPRLVLMSNGVIDMVHKKGWYIDPKTKQRIETDY